MTHHVHTLSGCIPTSLGGYLKGLGVLRLVAAQADAGARGAWTTSGFQLTTLLDLPHLLGFFGSDYSASPITNPWNSSTGYGFGKGAEDLVDEISTSTAPRLATFRATIGHIKEALRSHEGRDIADFKTELIHELRAFAPEPFIAWMDAALVTRDSGFSPNPILGSGGNDGRLDFSKGFIEALTRVIDAHTGQPTKLSDSWLRGALLGQPVPDLRPGTPGQFIPVGTGGASQGVGLNSKSRSNPWDTILTLEGAILFQAAPTRKLAVGPVRAAFPFTVQPAAAGYASAGRADEDGARVSELWLPLWDTPAASNEVAALCREARVTLRGTPTRSGSEFALAIGRLGTDRGIRAFERYGLMERNGKAYFASNLGRWPVRTNPASALVDGPLLHWIQTFNRLVDTGAPQSLQRVRRQVTNALLDLAEAGTPAHALALLTALGHAELALRRCGWPDKKAIRPVPPLAGKLWRPWIPDNSPEVRLAASLAGSDIRKRRSGVTRAHRSDGSVFTDWMSSSDPTRTWTANVLEKGLCATALRREVEASAAGARPTTPVTTDRTTYRNAPLRDLAAFMAREVDDQLLDDSIAAMMLLDGVSLPCPPADIAVPSLLSIVAPVVHRHGHAEAGECMHHTPGIVRRLSAGDGHQALILANRRLRSVGAEPMHAPWRPSPSESRRAAASMAFPLSHDSLRRLLLRITPPLQQPTTTNGE